MIAPMPVIAFDHLVVAAPTLADGVAWIEERTGASMGPGGRHAAMSTHNRLLGLGPGRFLEVIAIDPEAPDPGRARWFGLDSPAMQARLASGPALVHWVARAADLDAALAALDLGSPEVLALSRGDYRWRIGVPRDGTLQLDGAAPTLIRWDGAHPAERLPDSGCALESLRLGHPGAAAMLRRLHAAGFPASEPVEAASGPVLLARLATPRGMVELA
jgi:hypothetical protein